MRTKRIATLVAIVAVLALLPAAGSVVAGPPGQGPEPQNEAEPQGEISVAATVGSKISYQGVLEETGSPVTGTRNMVFRFYTNSSCSGSPVQSVTKNNVPVTNGLFNVDLSVSQYNFNGQGLWLRVQVGSTNLGCKEILPVPYALSLRPGARIDGSATGGQLYDAVLNVRNYNTGAGRTAIHGVSGSTVSGCPAQEVGVRGEAANGFGVAGLSSDNAGVFGYSSTSFGVRGDGNPGVRGYSTSGHGVYGESASTSGRGVYGKAPNYGVYGQATATSGATVGVWGETNSSSNWADGVFGKATADSGITTGVYGWSESTQGRGVMGAAKATSGETYGVKGESNSSSGTGVYGEASATSGETYGVYGKSDSPDGYGGYFEGDVHITGDLTAGGALIGAFPRPAYDSGWVAMNSGTQKILTHNLGGNVNNYVVDMQFKDTDERGINNYGIGGKADNRGVAWTDLTNTSIMIWRLNEDRLADQIRIRIWVYK